MYVPHKSAYTVFQLVYDYLLYWTNRKAPNKVSITQILFWLINGNYLS